MPNTHPAVEISSGVRVSHPPADAIVIFRWVSCSRSCAEGAETSFDGFYRADRRTIAFPCVDIFPFLSCKLLAVVTACTHPNTNQNYQQSVHSLFFPSLLLFVIAFGIHLLKGKVILHPQCIFFLLFS